MRRILRGLSATLVAAVLSGEAGLAGAEHPPPRGCSLAEFVLTGNQPLDALKPSSDDTERRQCLREYLAAVPADSILRKFEAPGSPEDAVPLRKRHLVEQIVIILGREARAEAAAFAAALPLGAEWEGMSEGPLREADFTVAWLAEHPGASIAPFLRLFEAHRLRAAYEAARARHEDDAWPVLARRYAEALEAARSSHNPLIGCVAADLQARPFVYLQGQGMP